MRPVLILLSAALLLSGCKRENMYSQRSSRNWDRNTFFANGTSMRHPVEGTVARTPYRADVPPPATIDAALLARGQEQYEIFCTPCHGGAGNGEGMIVQRGFSRPPSLTEGELRTAGTKVFYDAITKGYGAMYGFATRVAPADRWAVIAYIRALQRSQNTEVATLPDDVQAQLEAAK